MVTVLFWNVSARVGSMDGRMRWADGGGGVKDSRFIVTVVGLAGVARSSNSSSWEMLVSLLVCGSSEEVFWCCWGVCVSMGFLGRPRRRVYIGGVDDGAGLRLRFDEGIVPSAARLLSSFGSESELS